LLGGSLGIPRIDRHYQIGFQGKAPTRFEETSKSNRKGKVLMNVVRGLIIADPWISYILDGKKTWEMRSGPTNVRGAFALIRKETGAICGVATLAGVGWALPASQMLETCHLHQIPAQMIRSGMAVKWNIPWILTDVRRLETPVRYDHPSGAVTWVDLADDVSQEIAAQLR
jgi:ASCH domain-containing protein